MIRLLSYNIRYAGTGREDALASVIAASAADIVLLQEAERPDIVRRLAEATGLRSCGAASGRSLAYLSRVPIEHHAWHRSRFGKRAYLELVPRDLRLRIFGVHLSAIHSNVTEWRRMYELRALLNGIARHQDGFHVVAGDFNTLAPGEQLDIRRLPARLRAILWMTGRTVRYLTIGMMVEAGYKDAYRLTHRDQPGYTFPTWDPHVRLDYVFVPAAYADRVAGCDVIVEAPRAREASDHFPLVSDLRDLPDGARSDE